MSLLEFVNKYNGVFLAVFSLIVTTATCFYVFLTFKLLKESRKQREPDLYLLIQENELWPDFLEIIIQNTGSGPAFNIMISCNPDFRINNKQMFSDLSFIKSGFKYVGPNQKIRVASFFINPDSEEKAIDPVKFNISYNDNSQKNKNHEIVIDFNEYAKLDVIKRSWKHDLETHLRKISDNIPHISAAGQNISKKIDDLANELRRRR